MLPIDKMALTAIIACSFAADGSADPVDAAAAVAAHNEWRARVGAPELSWSAALEAKAGSWANQLRQNDCKMKHSGPGENLYWASPHQKATSKDENGNWIWKNSLQDVDEATVVDAWGSEVQWYDYASNACNAPADKSCGHYTQVVWKDTLEVGCAKAVCADNSQVWVCNYEPAGNIRGSKPY